MKRGTRACIRREDAREEPHGYSESRPTHQVFHCSLYAECCSPHRGCCPEHHTPDSSSASLSHHRLTTATRPSSHLNTGKKRAINKNPRQPRGRIKLTLRPEKQRAHPSRHHLRALFTFLHRRKNKKEKKKKRNPNTPKVFVM